MFLKNKFLKSASIISTLQKHSSIIIVNKATLVTADINWIDKENKKVHLLNQTYEYDNEWTNLNKNILSRLGKNIYKQKYHPLNHMVNQIKSFFYKKYTNRSGNAIFSVHDNLNPIVSADQNFDR